MGIGCLRRPIMEFLAKYIYIIISAVFSYDYASFYKVVDDPIRIMRGKKIIIY